MLWPSNISPLNERLIQELIETRQAEIRRCFLRVPVAGDPLPVRLLRLLFRGQPANTPSTRKRMVV